MSTMAVAMPTLSVVRARLSTSASTPMPFSSRARQSATLKEEASGHPGDSSRRARRARRRAGRGPSGGRGR